MALTLADKISIMGVLRGQINCYNDLWFSTRSKYTIEELLIVIIDILFKAFDNQNSDKLILNALNGIDFIILEFNAYEEYIEANIIERLESIEDKYNTYLEKNNLLENESIRRKINDIKNNLIQNSIVYNRNTEDEESEEIDEFEELEEIEELSVEDLFAFYDDNFQDTITSLKEEITEYTNKVKDLEKKITIQTRNIAKKDATIESQRAELAKLQRELNILSKNQEKQQAHIKHLESLEKELSESLTISERLYSHAEIANQRKDQKIKVLQGKLVDYEEETKRRTIFNALEQEIFNILTLRSATVDELVRLLRERKIDANAKKVYECILSLKNKIKIDVKGMRNFSPVYCISLKDVEINRNIEYITHLNSLDILVISDLHLGIVNESDKRMFDRIYDYCSNNRVRLILNLGDLFSYSYLANSDRLARIQYNNHILETAIRNIPYDKYIHHGILGGNHDRYILNYGIDPIEVLANSRSDISSLGYDHACLSFGQDNLVLHHIKKRYQEDSFNAVCNQELLDDINKYYLSSPFKQENTYIDLFGHFHRSDLNTEYGYALCPSLTNDRIKNGAWHLKIYFNELGNIDYIVFIPINYENKLIQKPEEVYQKKLTS